jgi:hypothetical protein
MRERPILFNGADVRAILAGQKVQTRRAVNWNKVAPGLNLRFTGLSAQRYPKGWVLESDSRTSSEWRCQPTPCPFGQPGDRLWVRETWMDLTGTGIEHRDMETGKRTRYAYGAESPKGSASDEARKDYGLRWRPSIHMPREACHLVLEITAVRVERLQQITADDCLAEGIGTRFKVADSEEDLRAQWRDLWTSAGGDWSSNPWVWVIEFKRVVV